MRLVLKPLFNAELPHGFEEIVLSKLTGREVKTGDTVEIDLLGKTLRFKVVQADPSPMRVERKTRIELTTSEIDEITLEFDDEVEEVMPFARGIAVVLGNRVELYDWKGQKVYSRKFDKLKEIRVTEERVVIVHGKNITILEP
ncbi:DUF6849 domain-containing protein [Thermococcus sp.]